MSAIHVLSAVVCAGAIAASVAHGQSPAALTVSISNPSPGSSGWFCGSSAAQMSSMTPPPGVQFPLGVVRYDASTCFFDCGFLCPPGTPPYPMQQMAMASSVPLPSGAAVYVYATRAGMTTPIWQKVNASLTNNGATFYLDGNAGDREMHGYAAIGVPDAASIAYQDLWWAGVEENGWGASIGQSGDRLFMAMYVYRDNGSPVWVVMPGGTWDAAHRVYSGTLYGAVGSSYQAYDPSRLTLSVSGSAVLTFLDDSSATLSYTIGGVTGTKRIQRQPVAPQAPRVQGPYAGLWWGGVTQNGWGLSLAHQNDTLFAVWYTYDTQGSAQWYVMPGAARLSSPESLSPSYSGTLYRTVGSPWLGATYDPTKLQVIPVGRLGFTFSPSGQVAQMSFTVDGSSGGNVIYKQPF